MANYAITNLKEIEDSAAGRGGGIEARFARKHLESEHLGISYFRYDANSRAPFGHRHREQEEVYVVLAGSGRIKLEDETHDIKAWDVIRVAPSVARALEAGADGLELIAIGSDRPEGGDGERIDDFWGEDF